VHAAALPVIATAWISRTPAVDPPSIEVTLAWAPPVVEQPAAPSGEATAAPPPAAEEPAAAAEAAPAPPPKPAPAEPQVVVHRPATVHRPLPVHRPTVAQKPAHPVAEAAPPPGASPGNAPAAAETVASTTNSAAVAEPLQVAAAPPPAKADVLAHYSRILLDRLERHKTYPVLAQRRGEEGTVTVRLTVSEDGRLLDVEPVGESPGRLVEASLAAVQAAAPFPPLPPELGSRQAVFNLPIIYRLR
jgi:periplasmic protein TonB